jgi:hypothetical protein
MRSGARYSGFDLSCLGGPVARIWQVASLLVQKGPHTNHYANSVQSLLHGYRVRYGYLSASADRAIALHDCRRHQLLLNACVNGAVPMDTDVQST